MNSVLEGRPALKKEVEKIAEVAGYLWQNGWAERNGGNITVNITDLVDDEIKALPAISEVKQIGTALPALKHSAAASTVTFGRDSKIIPIVPMGTRFLMT